MAGICRPLTHEKEHKNEKVEESFIQPCQGF